jgi:hypothetical protein
MRNQPLFLCKCKTYVLCYLFFHQLNLDSGDACHPMLPYLAQGANSALEDGAVLGGLLGKLTSKHQLPQALKLFEKLRKARGEAIVRETFKQVRVT